MRAGHSETSGRLRVGLGERRVAVNDFSALVISACALASAAAIAPIVSLERCMAVRLHIEEIEADGARF